MNDLLGKICQLQSLRSFCFCLFCCCLVAKSCLTLLRPHRLQPIRLLCPWDFSGKNTEVGCHFLLQGNLPNTVIRHRQILSTKLPEKPTICFFYLNQLQFFFFPKKKVKFCVLLYQKVEIVTLFFLFFFLIFLDLSFKWTVIALQCCVSFCCIVTRISSEYMCILNKGDTVIIAV